jgi:hypothetical protein
LQVFLLYYFSKLPTVKNNSSYPQTFFTFLSHHLPVLFLPIIFPSTVAP